MRLVPATTVGFERAHTAPDEGWGGGEMRIPNSTSWLSISTGLSGDLRTLETWLGTSACERVLQEEDPRRMSALKKVRLF